MSQNKCPSPINASAFRILWKALGGQIPPQQFNMLLYANSPDLAVGNWGTAGCAAGWLAVLCPELELATNEISTGVYIRFVDDPADTARDVEHTSLHTKNVLKSFLGITEEEFEFLFLPHTYIRRTGAPVTRNAVRNRIRHILNGGIPRNYSGPVPYVFGVRK